MKRFEIYIDGASKGNPGPSGVGVVICEGKEAVRNISVFIGNTTNNVAEYTALIYALQEALKLKAEVLKINTDSQLLYRQLKMVYKTRHPNIVGLYNQVSHLLPAFKEVIFAHIPREKNKGADRLATNAIREEAKKNVSLKTGRVGCGCSGPKPERKVRAPEDSVVGNTHHSAQVNWDWGG